MSTDKKNIIYTAGDIEKYFSGGLSAVQMHEMEKAALDDSFLAEAMEGYEAMKDKNWKDPLAAAHRQIMEAGSEAKVIPMHRSTGRWWKIAAAVLVIGSGAALTFILTPNKSEEKASPQIAQNITAAPDSGAAKDKTASITQTDSIPPASSYSYSTEKTTSTNGAITQANPQVKSDNLIVTKPGIVQLQDTVRSGLTTFANSSPAEQTAAGKTTQPATIPNNQPSSVNNNPVVANENNFAKNKEGAKQNYYDSEVLKRQQATANAAFDKKDQAPNNYFNAQVVAADNSPLPFSNISIKSENFGTYADVKGNFRLVSPDTLLTVEIKSAGYMPRTFQLHSNQPQNKIVLLEDAMAVREKTVIQNKDVSSNRKSRRATLLSDSVVNVEPADGWDNYNTYVDNNIDIPDDILKKEFHGEVEVVFDVNANGTVSNIRINKSMGDAYDEAAKRIIEQGPQWKNKKGKKTSAKVKVQF